MRCMAGWLVAGALATPGCQAFGQTVQEVPFEVRGHKIVVRGTIEGGREVRMLIDTAAACTAIDRRLASKLKLKRIPISTPIRAHGRLGSPPSVLVNDIVLGPIRTSRTCAAAEIPLPGIQMIVGLDVLRCQNLTIDLQDRRLVFESNHVAEFEAPFDPDGSLILIPALLAGRQVRLVLDTGTDMHCLNGRKAGSWFSVPPNAFWEEIMGMFGKLYGCETYLPNLMIGGDRWDNQRFLILRSPTPLGQAETDVPWDGILAPGPLGIKRIHIDFRQGLVKWSR